MDYEFASPYFYSTFHGYINFFPDQIKSNIFEFVIIHIFDYIIQISLLGLTSDSWDNISNI